MCCLICLHICVTHMFTYIFCRAIWYIHTTIYIDTLQMHFYCKTISTNNIDNRSSITDIYMALICHIVVRERERPTCGSERSVCQRWQWKKVRLQHHYCCTAAAGVDVFIQRCSVLSSPYIRRASLGCISAFRPAETAKWTKTRMSWASCEPEGGLWLMKTNPGCLLQQ